MKPAFSALFRKIPVIFLGTLMPTLSAETYTFSPDAEASDYLDLKRPVQSLFVGQDEGVGLLTFESEKGAALALFSAGGTTVTSSAKDVEIQFRIEGTVTLGIFLRAEGIDGRAYMVFLSPSESSLGLNISKTLVTGEQRPGETALARKQIGTYMPGEWYTLKISITDTPGAGTQLSAQLVESDSSYPAEELYAEDPETPTLEPGQLGFRFFGSGKVEIRRISMSE